jgi:hypothetical protein
VTGGGHGGGGRFRDHVAERVWLDSARYLYLERVGCARGLQRL